MIGLVPVKKSITVGRDSRTVLDWWDSEQLKVGNIGLLHEKFTHPEIKGDTYSQHLQKLIVGAAAGERKADWTDAINRRTALLGAVYSTCHADQTIAFNTDVLIGLGNSHPNDVGLTWHPTLGFPYIPASAIKGLCRSVADTVFSDDPTGQQLILDALGPAHSDMNEDNSGHTGRFIFFDALPIFGAKLILSGLTPHYQDYHSRAVPSGTDSGDPVFPTDTEAPVPISFLGVAAGSQFQFAIADRGTRTKSRSDDGEFQHEDTSSGGINEVSETVSLDDVLSWIILGLEMSGIGARTSRHFGFGSVF